MGEGSLEVRDLGPRLLVRGHPGQALKAVARDLGAHMLAGDDAVEAVVQDLEQPGLEVGAGREAMPGLQRQHQRVLDKIVGEIGVAGRQRPRIGAKLRHQRQHVLARVLRPAAHDPFAPAASNCRSMSAPSS